MYRNTNRSRNFKEIKKNIRLKIRPKKTRRSITRRSITRRSITRRRISRRFTHKKSYRKMVGGFNNFPVTDIHNSDDVFSIKPGQVYNFFGYKLSFYDFDLPEHQPFKEVLIEKSIDNACHKSIYYNYYTYFIKKSRFMLTITYNNQYDEEELDSFILANTIKENIKNDLYISLSCSRNVYSERKYYDMIDYEDSDGLIKTGFGTILRCILLKYVKTIGFNDIYNTAINYNMISYYKRWGFLLNTTKCNVHDEITNKHAIQNISEEELSHMITGDGYSMKLCGNDSSKLCNYAKTQLQSVWVELEHYTDIYN